MTPPADITTIATLRAGLNPRTMRLYAILRGRSRTGETVTIDLVTCPIGSGEAGSIGALAAAVLGLEFDPKLHGIVLRRQAAETLVNALGRAVFGVDSAPLPWQWL